MFIGWVGKITHCVPGRASVGILARGMWLQVPSSSLVICPKSFVFTGKKKGNHTVSRWYCDVGTA